MMEAAKVAIHSTKSEEYQPESLEQLRAKIDLIDHAILEQLSHRNELITQVAQYKRQHQVSIRDFHREREILNDRCDRAESMGLRSEIIESLFRLVMWGSRDRQAALKAEVPLDIEPKTIAVIGGLGGMGTCMASLFTQLGHRVLVADLHTEITPEHATQQADVVILSVPIDVTQEVIRQVAPFVREDALMMDVTSIKTLPVETMMECCRGSVIGTHPLFAPSVHSLQGQRVVLCPGRGDDWLVWLKQMLHARGFVLMESSPQDHDRAMSIVQVLVHFSTEVMGQTLARLGVGIEETLRFTSPVYLMELLMTARHFAQSPELYASIEMSNPDTSRVTEAFVEAASQLQGVLAQKDRKQFVQLFEQTCDYFGPFTVQALEQSSFLIDRLVERT